MSTRNMIPRTVEASLEARLAPFGVRRSRQALEDLDVEASRAVAPQREPVLQARLLRDVKLLFAALGAGGSAVPMGDNGRAASQLASYAESLAKN